MSRKRLVQTSLDLFVGADSEGKKAKMNNQDTSNRNSTDDSGSCEEIVSSQTTADTPELDNSQPLFADDEPSSSACAQKTSPVIEKQNSLGPELSCFQRMPGCSRSLEKLRPAENLTVLIQCDTIFVDSNNDSPPLPYPVNYVDKWDQNHVRLPCSKDNLYPTRSGNEEKLVNRWELIQNALCKKFTSSYDIEEVILSYNGRYSSSWNFRAFHKLLNEIMPKSQCNNMLNVVLPKIARLALQLPEICTQPIPLLKQTRSHTIVMSQKQVGCLLANAFFCTFPRRNVDGGRNSKKTEYYNYPRINFSRIFSGGKINIEKLKCILHYFERITENVPTGTVSFQRQSLEKFPDWKQSMTPLTKLHVSKKGTIEDFGDGMLQVDFANKFIGGGVLGEGCVQEEIRFLICPELMVSMLFTEVLLPNECLIMNGCERYSCYMGYADTFEWSASFVDETPRDSWGRRQVELVAIDAKPYYRKAYQQFSPDDVVRELNKAYCGFVRIGEDPKHLSAVATGNWGCGAFGGDKEAKSLIQMMAAAEAGRDVVYFTFDDEKFMTKLYDVYLVLQSRKSTISDIFKQMKAYYETVIESNALDCQTDDTPSTLFEFICCHKIV